MFQSIQYRTNSYSRGSAFKKVKRSGDFEEETIDDKIVTNENINYLQEINNTIVFDLNLIFSKLLEKEFKFFQTFIRYLFNNHDLIEITKEQFKIINEAVVKFKVNGKEIEKYIVIKYGDYIPSNYSCQEYESIYISIIKYYLKDTITVDGMCDLDYFHYFQNVLSIIEKNLKNFNQELSIKIISLIIDFCGLKDESLNEDDNVLRINTSYIYLLKSIISFKLVFDIQVYKVQFLPTMIFIFDRICRYAGLNKNNHLSFDECYFLFMVFDQLDQIGQRNNLLLKLLIYINRNGSNAFFQCKFQNEFANAIYDPTNTMINSKAGFSVWEELKFVVGPILKCNKFNVDQFNVFIKSVSNTLSNGTVSKEQVGSIFYKSVFPNTLNLLEEVQHQISLPIIKKLSTIYDFKYSFTRIISDMIIPQDSKLRYFFIVSDDLFENKHQLYEIYENIFFNLYTASLIEPSVEFLFWDIKSNPTKFKFISTKLPLLISILQISQIEQFMYPHFTRELDSLKCYNDKKICKLQDPIDMTKFPFYLVVNIVILIINNPHTSQFTKLQFSLISKKFHKMVIDIMNTSTEAPISIDYNFILENRTCYSLLQPGVSYLKYSVETTEIGYGDDDDYQHHFRMEDTHSYRVRVISGFQKSHNFLSHFKEIKILDYHGDLSSSLLNYFIYSKNLVELIIRTTNQNANHFNLELKLLSTKKQVSLYLFSGHSQYGDIKFDLVAGSTISIGQFFGSFYSNVLDKLQSLILIIEQWNIFELNDKTHPVVQFLKTKYDPTKIQLSNLTSLEFLLNTNKFKLCHLLKMFSSAKNLTKLKFTLNFKFVTSDIDNVRIVETIFRNVSTNPLFSNVSKIQIQGNHGYTVYDDWSKIYTYSFMQDTNYNNVDFIRNTNESNCTFNRQLEYYKGEIVENNDDDEDDLIFTDDEDNNNNGINNNSNNVNSKEEEE